MKDLNSELAKKFPRLKKKSKSIADDKRRFEKNWEESNLALIRDQSGAIESIPEEIEINIGPDPRLEWKR